MRCALLAACVLALGSGACGRVGYDVIAPFSGGGGGGAGGNTLGSSGSGGGGGGTAGTAGTVGNGGGSGSGGALTVDGGSCVDAAAPCGSVRVQYHAGDLNKPTDPWIRPQINLYNDSSADVPLAEL